MKSRFNKQTSKIDALKYEIEKELWKIKDQIGTLTIELMELEFKLEYEIMNNFSEHEINKTKKIIRETKNNLHDSHKLARKFIPKIFEIYELSEEIKEIDKLNELLVSQKKS